MSLVMVNFGMKMLFIMALGVTGTRAKGPIALRSTAMSTVQTPSNIDRPAAILQAFDQNLFVFRVKACNDAQINLLGRVGRGTVYTEIYIGGWGNTLSAVRIFPEGEAGNLVLTEETPNILNCHEMRTFWLSWQNDRIRVGRGPMLGQQTFLDFNRTAHGYTHSIGVIRLATREGTSGVWQFPENQVDNLVVVTPPSYGYNSLWKTTQQKYNVMFFEVRACQSAHIAMSPVVGAWRRQAFEVVIGGQNNTRSVITLYLQGGSPPAVLNMTGLLDCNRFRPFWVGWRNRTINFGKGYIYNEQELLRWELPRWINRPIRSLGFSTFEGATGRWRFPENTESAIVFHTPMDPEFNKTFVVVPRETHFRFEVKTCTSAMIYISPRRGPLRRDVIFIGLGFNQNRHYFIRMNDITRVERDIANVLECERFKLYWISWEGGLIKVGVGGMIDREPIIQWQSPYPVIFSVGYRSPESVAHWRIKTNQVDNTRVMTDPSTYNSRPHAIMWVHDQLMKVFSVRGCSSASIALLNSHAWVDNRAIEVTIGAENNQKVVIAQAKDGGDVMTEVTAPNLLNCRDTSVFWISWYRFNITVGRGWRYGQDTLISVPMISNYFIQAVRVRGAISRLIWRFPGDPSDYVMRSTLGDLRYEWMRPHPDRKWINMWIRACSSVAIALSAQYSLEPSLAYEIGLDWGSDSVSYIKKDGSVMVQLTKRPTRLDCNTPRPFWVSWDSGEIRIGTGNVPGFAQIITWTDKQPRDIRSIGVTSGDGQMAEWQFATDDLVESTSVLDPGVGPTKYWSTIRHRQSLQLKITTCKEFHISMTTILGMYNTNLSYTIELGTNDGSVSRLRTGSRVQETVNTPSLFKCGEERDVWLSWVNDVILVGRGLQIGRLVFLSFNDLNPFAIHAIGFASYDERPARVRMLHDEDTAEFAAVETPIYHGLSGGQIAGIVIGVLLFVALITGAIYIIYRRPEPIRRLLYPDPKPTFPVRAGSMGFKDPFQEDQQPSGLA